MCGISITVQWILVVASENVQKSESLSELAGEACRGVEVIFVM